MTKNILVETRRYDLDWMRVIAFGVLIYFHAAVAFLPRGLPLTLNAEPSQGLAMFVSFSHNFRLALLFFISGCGVTFALKKRSKQEFYRDRSRRLLLPLLFGICVLVPFMVYLEKQYLGEKFDSYLHFYTKYFVSGVYPEAYLSWHHFWFLAYLFLMCILAWPILRWATSPQGAETRQRWTKSLNLYGTGIYSLILPLLVFELLLRPVFPGHRDLISDWASFVHWFVLFLVGSGFALDSKLLDAAARHRRLSLSAALIVSGLLFLGFWQQSEMRLYPFSDNQISILNYITFSVLKISAAWLCILTCVGFAARYLNRNSRTLHHLGGAVYPVFCLHLPVLVAMEFLILPTSWTITTKFLLISNLSLILLLIMYWLLKPVRFLHPWLGYR